MTENTVFELANSPLTNVFQPMQDVRELTSHIDRDTILFIKEQLLQANMDKLFLELERVITVATQVAELNEADVRKWYARAESALNAVAIPGLEEGVDRFSVPDEDLQSFGALENPEKVLYDAGLLTLSDEYTGLADAIADNILLHSLS